MINSGMIWEEVVIAVRVSKSRIQAILREYYAASGGADSPWYKKLLKKARENEKARKSKAQAEENQEDTSTFPKEVTTCRQ